MNEVEVWVAELVLRSGSWADRAAELKQAAGTLTYAQTCTAPYGERVAAALTTHLSTWEANLLEQGNGAQGISENLDLTYDEYVACDESVRDGLSGMVPWDSRTLDPMEAAA